MLSLSRIIFSWNFQGFVNSLLVVQFSRYSLCIIGLVRLSAAVIFSWQLKYYIISLRPCQYLFWNFFKKVFRSFDIRRLFSTALILYHNFSLLSIPFFKVFQKVFAVIFFRPYRVSLFIISLLSPFVNTFLPLFSTSPYITIASPFCGVPVVAYAQ